MARTDVHKAAGEASTTEQAGPAIPAQSGGPRARWWKRTGSSGSFRSASSSSNSLGPTGPVVAFSGLDPSRTLCEFLNFYMLKKPFGFHLPACAQKPGFPKTVICESSEKAIMVTKAAMMSDRACFDKMVQSKDPREVKALGRQVKPFDDDLWMKNLDQVTFEAVKQKFASDPGLAEVLLSTGDSILAEATGHDRVWGVGIPFDDPRVQDPSLWEGMNVLGTALMRAREHLRKDPEWKVMSRGQRFWMSLRLHNGLPP